MKTPKIQATAKLHQWWKPKASNLLAVLYIVMLITGLPSGKALWLFIPSVVTILGIGSFGHLINDWYDIDADQKAGKSNHLALLSVWQRRGVALSAMAVALLPWLILPFNHFSILLLALEFTFLLAYAIPPLRLKERQVWPLLADGAYAYAIPAVLAAYTFFLAGNQFPDRIFLGLLFLWQLALGVRHFMNHLALDRLNDIATNTLTLATSKGNRYIHNLIRWLVFPTELLAFLAFAGYVAKYDLLLALIVFGLWFFFTSLHLILAIGRAYPLITYRFSKTTQDWFYQNWWPLAPLVLLITQHWLYIFLGIGHLLLFHPIRQRLSFLQGFPLPGSFITRSLFSRVAWIIVGFPVFFFNKIVLGNNQSKIEKPSQPASSNLLPPAEEQKNKKPPSIAIVNINKSKYTETFIQGLLPRLPYRVHYLYGGELPQFDHDDRHFLSNWSSFQAWAAFLEEVLHLEYNYFLKHSIGSYLQAKKIRLVLAEFGPVGVQILPITRDAGIPLIVYFHGYDVFHKEILQKHITPYQTLFQEAHTIIGVSEIMLNRLQQLGAPREKLTHLPAFVNLDLFPYTNHSRLPPRFLAVGRFAETKSPHLTILAFHQVVQEVPEATLTLIGKGGGGELFEACLILVRALGIAEKVTFKGVLSHEEVAAEMQKARVFVQHSLTTPENEDMEGKPVAVMEAMACGLPVVATRHSGISELIVHTITGLLVSEYDIQAMADAMLLLAKDEELARCIGQKASESIHHHPLISRHLEILKGIIDNSIT